MQLTVTLHWPIIHCQTNNRVSALRQHSLFYQIQGRYCGYHSGILLLLALHHGMKLNSILLYCLVHFLQYISHMKDLHNMKNKRSVEKRETASKNDSNTKHFFVIK